MGRSVVTSALLGDFAGTKSEGSETSSSVSAIIERPFGALLALVFFVMGT